MGNVERKILGIDNSLDEGEELWDKLLAVVGDKHTTDVQLDVVALLGWLKAIHWGTLWHVEDSLELKLALNREVLDSEVLFPIVGDVLVECGILLLGDVVWVSHPDWLLLVHQLPLVGDFLHLLLLLLLLLIDLLDLRGITFLVIGLLVLLIVVADLLLGGLLHPQADWVVDELRVLLDELLNALLVE